MRRFAFALLLLAAVTGVGVGNIHAAEETKPKPQEPVQKYSVEAGESLSIIATNHQLETWRPLWNANPDLQNPDAINPGQELVIPTGETTDRPLPAGYGEPVAAAASAAPAATYHSAPAAKVTRSAPGGDVLSRVRLRESGGNYATNTGNGYYGAYQYDVGTWNNYGGYRYASDAPPEVQDAKAAETYARRGCSPWPSTCY